jgi:hypothetical protein
MFAAMALVRLHKSAAYKLIPTGNNAHAMQVLCCCPAELITDQQASYLLTWTGVAAKEAVTAHLSCIGDPGLNGAQH